MKKLITALLFITLTNCSSQHSETLITKSKLSTDYKSKNGYYSAMGNYCYKDFIESEQKYILHCNNGTSKRIF